MTNLDHGKFTRTTIFFHQLLAIDVFLLFFTGYAIMFNDELWWLVEFMGGNQGVVAVHRLTGFGLIVLTVFWITLMLITARGRGNFKEVLPRVADIKAAIQDVKFALGYADERHPHARQFAGYSADEVPLLSYIGKGVIWIFTIELTLLMISGLLIWSKTALMSFFQTKAAAMAFVTFHGLLGVIMFMGVMFHIFEHGTHPAFYPVEMKAFIPKDETPAFHGDPPEDRESLTGIERLSLAPSWNLVANTLGVLVVVGIASVLAASIFDEGYPVPADLSVGGGPTNLLMTIGINAAVLVLLVGVVMSTYGSVLRIRWENRSQERRETAADGVGRDD